MLRTLLLCGLLAGLCGGLLAAGFASVAGEPAVDRAIAYETAHERPAAAGGHHHHAPERVVAEPAPVSRSLQKSAGLLTATLVDGLALGGLFALAFALAYGRVSRAGPGPTAVRLAGAAFAVVALVPFVKYPASPPAVGDPDTIGRRTALYVVMLAISVLAAVAATRLRPALARRAGEGAGTGLALLAYVALVVAAGLVLPGVHEVPRDFPATTLWRFREASIGMQAVLWATVGAVFAWAAERVMAGRPVLPRRRALPARAGR